MNFELALQYPQAGNLRPAELLYRQILLLDPRSNTTELI
jgi:hypothetical protein